MSWNNMYFLIIIIYTFLYLRYGSPIVRRNEFDLQGVPWFSWVFDSLLPFYGALLGIEGNAAKLLLLAVVPNMEFWGATADMGGYATPP